MAGQGIKKLRRIQLGKETTAGTKVAATTTWRGMGTIEDALEIVFVDEDIGYKTGVDRTYIPKVEARLDLDETPATYEQILHILGASVETAAATLDGAAVPGYIWVYPFTTTSDTASVTTYTVEGGDNVGEEEFGYGFIEKWALSGSAGEAVNISASWLGRQVSTGTFTVTSTASIPAVEEILFGKGKLYIDNDTGTIGTTQITSSWLDFNLDVTSGWQPVYTGDGALYFTFLKHTGAEITLDLTFEHDAASLAQKTRWRSELGVLVRMVFEGSTFNTAGSSFSVKTLRIDLAGNWESFEKIGDRDGNDILSGTLRVVHDTTSDSFATITVVNDLATVN